VLQQWCQPGHFLNENCYKIFTVKARLNLKTVFCRFYCGEQNVLSQKITNKHYARIVEILVFFLSLKTTIVLLLCELDKILKLGPIDLIVLNLMQYTR
jgi:hypothetical protein